MSEHPVRLRELPDHEKPRERLIALGATALSDAELIAILLRVGIAGAGVRILDALVIPRGAAAQARAMTTRDPERTES